MNEEEVKIKIVLPFLKQLGVELTEIELETSFTIRVGRHLLAFGKPRKRSSVGARLDILVKRGGKNLFIIEVKEANLDLTADNRDQAISYARLVHPIAPYALLTNGTTWQLFDTVTKTEIPTAGFQPAPNPTLELGEELCEQALGLFFRASKEHVQEFCRAQIAESMRPIEGTPAEIDKKFISQLHVPNEEISKRFHLFLQAPSPGFLILGASGMGKTCEMCHLAKQLVESNCAAGLFYQGYLLESGIGFAVAQDFAWAFPDNHNFVNLIEKLQRTLDQRIVIFIDGIDEWTHLQRLQNLVAFLKTAQNQKVKLVLSCKSETWDDFLRFRGSPTGIEDYLFHSPLGEDKSIYKNTITGFDSESFVLAIQKYSSVFGVEPQFEIEVYNEAQRNPFMLRVLFSVVKSLGIENLSLTSLEFLRSYYDLLIQKTGNTEIAHAQLTAVARALFDANVNALGEDVLRKTIGLGLNERLFPALVEHNILTRSNDVPPKVSFYFQQLRDFLLGTSVHKWLAMDPKEFSSSLTCLAKSGPQADVVAFVYRHASEAQKRAIDGVLFKNATEYLGFYLQFLSQHFPALKAHFEPFTENEIGFIAEILVPEVALGLYGFRPLQKGQPRICFVPVESFLNNDSDVMYHQGAGALHYNSSVNYFRSFDIIPEVLENEVRRQVKSLVENKFLNERKCKDLMCESLASMVSGNLHFFQELFHITQKPAYGVGPMVRFSQLIYPFKWGDVSEVFRRNVFADQLRDECLEKKRKNGVSGPTFLGSPITAVIFADELSDIVQKAKGMAKSDAPIQTLSFQIQQMEKEIVKVIFNLKLIGTSPEWDWSDRTTLFNACRSDSVAGLRAVQEYLVRLFRAFLENYSILVDDNFPSFRLHFKLRNKLPIGILIYVPPEVIDDIRTGGFFRHDIEIYYCKPASPMACNVVQVINNKVTSLSATIDGNDYNVFTVQHCGILELTATPESNFWPGRTRFGGPLHSLVYERIQTEISEVLKQI